MSSSGPTSCAEAQRPLIGQIWLRAGAAHPCHPSGASDDAERARQCGRCDALTIGAWIKSGMVIGPPAVAGCWAGSWSPGRRWLGNASTCLELVPDVIRATGRPISQSAWSLGQPVVVGASGEHPSDLAVENLAEVALAVDDRVMAPAQQRSVSDVRSAAIRPVLQVMAVGLPPI